MNTNDSNLPRRRFLAAGAVLAAGALAIPIATASAAPIIMPATDADLWTIINRRIYARHYTEWPVCECHECVTLRATPYTCAVCGYDGEPIVCPCDCAEQWDSWTSANAHILSNRTLSAKDREKIEAFQARIVGAGRPMLCPHDDSHCAHGGTICPACGDSGSDDPFEGEGEALEVAAMLRDLRAALRRRAVT